MRLSIGSIAQRRAAALVAAIALTVGACGGSSTSASPSSGPDYVVLATTSVFADIAKLALGDTVMIDTIVPAGVDVHTFEPSPADAQKLTDADLIALVDKRAATGSAATIELLDWSVASSRGGGSSGRVEVRINGEERKAEAAGNGPVDALYEAIDLAVEPSLGWRPNLSEYEIRAVSEGEDAQGQVSVKCRRSVDIDAAGKPLPDTRIVSGQGLSTNIIDASLVAYITAANKLAAISSGAPSAPTKGSREAMQ